jgi:hypothetical protein
MNNRAKKIETRKWETCRSFVFPPFNLVVDFFYNNMLFKGPHTGVINGMLAE